MLQYLARNFKAGVNSFVSLRKLAPSRNVVFNQTGMDFVTELSFCIETPVVMTKSWFLEVASQLGKSFKVSV